jgi:hypothetical protein
MTVEEFADILLDPQARVIDAVFYPWDTPLGFRAEFECRNRRYWYSVSFALRAISPAEVAAAIMSPTRQIQSRRANKSAQSFEATVWSGDRCYRVGGGNKRNLAERVKAKRVA